MQRDPFSADTLGRMRYAGGHIHLSYNHAVVPHFVAARFLDLYLTLPWIDWDHQPRRRATYGKAGLYRPKQYGIEYRTPSNWWLWTSDSLAQTYAENALHFARRSYEADFINALSDAYVSMPWDLVQQAIAREDGYAGQMLVEMANNRFGLGIRGPR